MPSCTTNHNLKTIKERRYLTPQRHENGDGNGNTVGGVGNEDQRTVQTGFMEDVQNNLEEHVQNSTETFGRGTGTSY